MPTPLVLVVDDDASMCRLVQRTLEKGGLPSDIAGTAAEAIDLLRVRRHRVVISDVNMPEISGPELVSQIKEIAPLTQVIMLTADTKIAPAADSIARGACEYFSKSESLSLLVEATHQCLGRAQRWWSSFEKRPLVKAPS